MTDEYRPKVIIEGADTDVPRIVVLHSRTEEQRKSCVDKLRTMLAKAEAGELLDVMIVTLGPEGSVSLHWTPIPQKDLLRAAGALDLLRVLLLQAVVVNNES